MVAKPRARPYESWGWGPGAVTCARPGSAIGEEIIDGAIEKSSERVPPRTGPPWASCGSAGLGIPWSAGRLGGKNIGEETC